MSRRLLAAWLFLLFSVAVFVLMVVVVRGYVRDGRITREMAVSLRQIDTLIEDSEFAAAERAIVRSADYASSSGSWLRLIRRAWMVAEALADYSAYASVSDRAAASLPGNADLQALALYGELRTGRYREAGERGAVHLADQRRYRTLAAEAFLRAGQAVRLEGADDLSALTRLGRGSSVEELRQAESISGDLRFRANAVLRLLEAGRLELAVAESRNLRFQRAFPLLAAYIAFDAGDYDAFFAHLSRVPDARAGTGEVLVLTAEIYLQRGEYADSVRIYDELIATESADIPAAAFLNRAWIARQVENRPAAAEAVLTAGLDRYPFEWSLIRAMAIEAAETDEQWTRQFLEEAEREYGAAAALLAERLFAVERQVSAGVARLWQLHERYPNDPGVRRYLAWFLSGLPGTGELNRLLARHAGDVADEAGGEDPLVFFRGVAAVASGDLDGGLDFFATSARANGEWHGAVNGARIALHRHRVNEAEELVELAASLLPPDARAMDRSNQAALEAAMHAYRGQYRQGAEFARQALEYDSGNLHAVTVLRYVGDRL